MTGEILVNGRPTRCVDCSDRGFQYGDGVFTTTPIRKGRPALFERHLARLARDTARLAIEFPRQDIVQEVAALLDESTDGILKVQVTRGLGGRGYRTPEVSNSTRVISVHPPSQFDPQLVLQGAAVRICRHRLGWNPALAGIKHMNRLEQVLARSEWSDAEIFEGLMLDYEGSLIEGTMTNVFLVQHGRLCTPRLDRCGVEGVMRALVLESAVRVGYPVCERRIGPEELLEAQEVFLTNSVVGVVPVRRVEQASLAVGSLTREMQRMVSGSIETDRSER